MILHLIDSLGRGGAERMLVQSIRALPKLKHSVLTLRPPHTLAPELGETPWMCLGYRTLKDFPQTIWKLKRHLQRRQPSIVHSHLYWSTILGRFAIPQKTPHVRTIHNMMSHSIDKAYPWLGTLERLTHSGKEVTVCVSNAVFDDYNRYFGFRGPAQVVRNFVDHKFDQRSLSLRVKPERCSLKLIQLASLRPLKNQQYLLDVMERLRDKPIYLDIYGHGPDRERLQQRISSQQLRVRLCGEQVITPELLQRYDLLVAPSLHEGYGLAVAEALACGLPVMISAIPAHHEIAKDCAMYIDPLKPDSMIDQLQQMLSGKITLPKAQAHSRCIHLIPSAGHSRFQSAMMQLYRSML